MSGRWQGIAFAIAAVVVAIVTAWVGYWMGFAGQLPSDALLRADRHLSGILRAAALFTPLFVLYLTWRNWLTARHKIKVDLFDRRWGLWREVERIYSETIEGRDFTSRCSSAQSMRRGRRSTSSVTLPENICATASSLI